MAQEKGIRVDEKRIGPLAHKSIEGCIDLAAGSGLEDHDLQPNGTRSRCHVSQRRLRSRCISRVYKYGNTSGRGHPNSRRSSSRFAANSPARKLTPVRLPPGRARLATRPSLTGSSLTMKTIGIVVVALA